MNIPIRNSQQKWMFFHLAATSVFWFDWIFLTLKALDISVIFTWINWTCVSGIVDFVDIDCPLRALLEHQSFAPWLLPVHQACPAALHRITTLVYFEKFLSHIFRHLSPDKRFVLSVLPASWSRLSPRRHVWNHGASVFAVCCLHLQSLRLGCGSCMTCFILSLKYLMCHLGQKCRSRHISWSNKRLWIIWLTHSYIFKQYLSEHMVSWCNRTF